LAIVGLINHSVEIDGMIKETKLDSCPHLISPPFRVLDFNRLRELGFAMSRSFFFMVFYPKTKKEEERRQSHLNNNRHT
jgi:hypothetical protein